jgi:hypothetical protein
MSGSIPMWVIVCETHGKITTAITNKAEVVDVACQMKLAGHRIVGLEAGATVIEGVELHQLLEGCDPAPYENFPR